MARERELQNDEDALRCYDAEPGFTRVGSEEASARNSVESQPERAYPAYPGR